MIGTNELAVLFEDGAYLVFDVHAAEQRVECLAARHKVVWMVGATCRCWNEMLDARLGLRDGAVAEEAKLPLNKHHALELSRGHRAKLFGSRYSVRLATPNDPKLSDRRSGRGTCR